MSEKSHKLLRGGRDFWGERVKYFDSSEVAAALKAGGNVRSAEFCPKCETELSRVVLYFDAINSNLPERIEQYGTDPRKLGLTSTSMIRVIGR